MLIATLPPVHQEELLKKVIEHQAVDAVRINTGSSSPFDPRETLRRIQKLAKPLGKSVHVDLKGKQLRVVEWANLPEGAIILNHAIKASPGAKVFFRGEDTCVLKEIVRGREIFVDPLPKGPVGRGQAVNILADDLEIEGGLLPLDYEYIEVARAEGITRFMLSFVESFADISELERALPRLSGKNKYEICLKIESKAGLNFVSNADAAALRPYQLMAARDDLMIHIGVSAMPNALKLLIQRDPKAICASRLLMGLETGGVTMADVSDLEYMKLLGYKDFMLSDGISREHFGAAMEFWQMYKKISKK